MAAEVEAPEGVEVAAAVVVADAALCRKPGFYRRPIIAIRDLKPAPPCHVSKTVFRHDARCPLPDVL